jgi:hypothetical protein
MSKKKENVSNETIKNENLESELNNNAPEENNDAENSKADETNGKKENVSNDFKEKIQNTSIDRVKVVAKYNNGSFDKGCEYEISKKVLENYNGLFDVL